jgi:hypothetical protein
VRLGMPRKRLAEAEAGDAAGSVMMFLISG